MQIVIDIAEDDYYDILQYAELKVNTEFENLMIVAIKNGTPLPKGRGRLIILSEDAVKREQTPLSFSCQKWISEVGLSNATVRIIEADKAGKRGEA